MVKDVRPVQTDTASPPPNVVTRLCRPRRDRYRVLSILWIFPSSGALVILGLEARGATWLRSREFSLAALSNVPVHVWIALLLLLAHALFLYLAYSYRDEPWHEVSFEEPESVSTAPPGKGVDVKPSKSELPR